MVDGWSQYIFKEIILCVIVGNKSGNRRTANIRSIGHSDLFSLSKEDLTNVLSEFPAAKRHLEEKGRQILTKMGMLEENEEGGDGGAATVQTKINNLESNLENLHTKLARLMVELESSNVRMQARVEQLELKVAALHTHLPEDEEDAKEAQGRGEGVRREVQLEREEAEGEEEQEASDVKMKKQRQGEDVANEGDGESTKSTKEENDRKIEEDKSIVLKDPEFPEQKQENVRKNKIKEEDNRPGKGDGAEIEAAEMSSGESGEKEMKRQDSEEK